MTFTAEEKQKCAERELREEAGVVARRWDQLGMIVTIPSFCDERITLFLARDLTGAERELDHDEVIKVERVPLDEALHSGSMTAARTQPSARAAGQKPFLRQPGTLRISPGESQLARHRASRITVWMNS